MLKIEYDLLVYVQEHPSCQWSDVLNAFDPQSSCNSIDSLLRCLLQEGLLQVKAGETPRSAGSRSRPRPFVPYLPTSRSARKKPSTSASAGRISSLP